MMKLVALTDYKGRFGSKHFDSPYRSGMKKDQLVTVFHSFGIELCFVPMNKAWDCFPKDATYFIYTGIEDQGYLYKSFIEDVVLGLTQMGKVALPDYMHLRANNNKVVMEFLRRNTCKPFMNTIQTRFYGALEELKRDIGDVTYPAVIKKAAGASGRGVFKAIDESDLISKSSKASSSVSWLWDLKDFIRGLRHRGYMRDSKNRNKFIIQNFIPNLKNDWKVYWFNGEMYVFYRPVFAHRDFIASGGGYDNYFYDEDAHKPDGFFEFAEEVMSCFKVPHASMDIAFDGERYHLIEIQFLFFGTAGIPYSKGFYRKENDKWIFMNERREIEYVYAKSMAVFLNNEAEGTFC